MRERARLALRIVLAIAMATLGVMHFIHPGDFAKMIPPALPAHVFLVWLSGAFEILGAVGIMIRRTRIAAAFGLMALFVAVFPANIYMALHPDQFGLPTWALWVRLSLQPILIAWAYWIRR